MQIHPVLDGKTSVFHVDVGSERNTVISLKYDVSRAPEEVVFSEIHFPHSLPKGMHHPLQLALCVLLHHLKKNTLVQPNTVIKVTQKSTVLRSPSPVKPLISTVLDDLIALGFGIVVEGKEIYDINHEKVKRKEWITLRGRTGHVLAQCRIKVPHHNELPQLPSLRRATNPVADSTPILTKPKRKNVLTGDNDDDEPPTKQQKTDNKSTETTIVNIPTYQKNAREAFKAMGFDLGGPTNQFIIDLIAGYIQTLPHEVTHGAGMKRPLDFFFTAQHPLTRTLLEMDKNAMAGSRVYYDRSNPLHSVIEIVPTLASQVRRLHPHGAEHSKVENYTTPVLRRISGYLWEETQLDELLELSENRKMPQLDTGLLFVFFHGGLKTVPIGYVVAHRSVSGTKLVVSIDMATATAPFVSASFLSPNPPGLSVHDAIRNLYNDMFEAVVDYAKTTPDDGIDGYRVHFAVHPRRPGYPIPFPTIQEGTITTARPAAAAAAPTPMHDFKINEDDKKWTSMG